MVYGPMSATRVRRQQPVAVGDGGFESPAEPAVALQPLKHLQEEELEPFPLGQAPVVLARLEEVTPVQAYRLLQRLVVRLGAGKGA